jgi:branched-chain amino acid transport system substrate-binding protein
MQIALDEANTANVVKGHKLSLTTADMGISVEKAVTEARRMILDEKLHYVVVGSHSGAAVALADLIKNQDKDVFGLGAFATTKRFTGEEGHAMIGRANLSTIEIGRIMAAHLKPMTDVKRIAVISPDFEFGKHFTEDFVAALKVARPDIVVVRQEWPKFGAADFTPQVTALQASKIDMIVSSLFSGDLANFLKAAKGFDLFSGGTRLFTSGLDLLKLATFKDGLPEGALGTLWYPFYAINSPESTAFVEEVKKRSDTYPTGSALVGYIAGKMLAEAIGKASNPDDPKTVAKVMGTVAFDSPVGPVRVRACDNMALYNFYVGSVKHDPLLPDGIGAVNVKPYNTADYARSCEEIAKLRQ